jgi:hypothetical protein
MKYSCRAAVLAVAASAALIAPLALPASAAAPKPSVACAKETSPPLKAGATVSTLASCTPAALKAGGGSTTKTTKNQTAGTVTDTIVWKGKQGTTVAVIKYAGAKTLGKCKAPYDTRVTITGTVKSATGPAAKITKKGEPVKASICAIAKVGASQGKTILEPGTKFTL